MKWRGGRGRGGRALLAVACQRAARAHCPRELRSHGVCLSFHCGLSSRDAAALLCGRGLLLTDAAIRTWCRKGG